MPPTLHLGCAALLGAGIALAAQACSDAANPSVLGGCTAGPQGACGLPGSPAVGGGPGNLDGGTEAGGPGNTGGATEGNGITTTDAGDAASGGACGSAASLLNAGGQCAACIVANCCQASQSCFGQCLDLVQCNAGINNCVADFPTGVTSFNALVSCVTGSCGTLCPTLALTGTGVP